MFGPKKRSTGCSLAVEFTYIYIYIFIHSLDTITKKLLNNFRPSEKNFNFLTMKTQVETFKKLRFFCMYIYIYLYIFYFDNDKVGCKKS